MGNYNSCHECCAVGHSSSLETTVVNKRRKRTRLGKIRLAENDETNLLLDKWKSSDVQQLMRVYKKNAGTGQNMNKEAFFQVFSELQTLPNLVANAAFNLFDRGNTGVIDFREFCTAVAISCLSSKKEQIHFVFDLFDGNHDGKLTKKEVKLLLHTSITSMRRMTKVEPTSNGVETLTLGETDEEWMKRCEMELFNHSSSSSSIHKDEFNLWAMNSKSMYIFLKVLEIFRIFPTKDNQYRIASSILNKWNGLCDDSQSVYVVSVQWWEEWCDYISLRVNNDNANNPYYTRVVDDSQNKSNVSANDKKIVKNLLTVESNTPVKSTMNSDDNNSSTLTNSKTVRQESVDFTEVPTSPLLRQLSHTYGERPSLIENNVLSGDIGGSIKGISAATVLLLFTCRDYLMDSI